MMKKIISRIILIFSFLIISLILIYPGPCTATGKSNVSSDRYVINQKFDGRAFPKDNNVWVYNQKFADTFGMPPDGIYPDLKGIEAAAFRVEDAGYKFCGMGGKEENCMSTNRCIIDIYIDDAKYPLPWATDQMADWMAVYNSTRWLRTAKEFPIHGSGVPLGVIPYKQGGGVRPFADPATHQEAVWEQNAYGPDNEGSYNFAFMYGFKRQAIAGLTMISLDYGDLKRNPEKKMVTFRLQSCKVGSPPICKRFYTFQLPDVFNRKIDAVRRVKSERDTEYYKSVLKSMNKSLK